MRDMHIAHVAPEMAPLAKAGGLGDVVGSLPAAQARDGHEVTVVLPAYGFVLDRLGLRDAPRSYVNVPVPWGDVAGGVIETSYGGVRLLLLVHDAFYDRAAIYGGAQGSYGDNGMRFAWFSAAALEALRALPRPPHAVLAHDWPTGLVPVLLRSRDGGGDPLAESVAAIVIHNLAHQGVFPLGFIRSFGVADRFVDAHGIEALGFANLLKGAIFASNVVLTVSPTYAREIVTPEYGEGLDFALRARARDLVGILNGIDVAAWDPGRDRALPAPYDAGDLAGKATCKTALQRELGLRVAPDAPLFGIVSRLDRQKGIDFVEWVAPGLVGEGAQVALLGTGQQDLVHGLRGLAHIWQQSVSVVEKFDEPLARRIYAGSDFFLMPSRFEPCGLGQMVALRYGTLPVARRTGGLADTIRDAGERPDDANGFLFDHATADGLRWACGRAMHLYHHDRPRLDRMRRAGMHEDFSWDRSARAYDAALAQARDALRGVTP